MAKASRAESTAHSVQELLSHPYVKRTLEDPEIRDNARAAVESARAAFMRLKETDSPASALFDDRKLQEELKTAGQSIARSRERLVQPAKKHHLLRNVVILLAGAGLAIALSEGLRNRVLDLLFGAEEEFDYVSTTAPPEPAATATTTPEGSTNGSQETTEPAGAETE